MILQYQDMAEKAGALNRPGTRLETLDLVRGITLVSMILYHGMWDFLYLSEKGASMTALRTWYEGPCGHLWQQSICRTFILLSGFCVPFSRHLIRRGLQVSAGGIAVSAVTILAMYEERVLFGVLTFLGAAMLVTAAAGRFLRPFASRGEDVSRGRGGSAACLAVCLLLFHVTRWINPGYLRLGPFVRLDLPSVLYTFGSGKLPGYLLTGLGFTMTGFFSTDYFSLIPWIFLFWAGLFLNRAVLKGKRPAEQRGAGVASADSGRGKESSGHTIFHLQAPVLNLIGRHSLPVYLIHQPVLYLLTVIFL
jgi:uncharacterized membrane protein